MSAAARATVRALVLIAVVLDVPVVARLVRRATRAPVVELVDVDGIPVELHRPPHERPCPAWVFVNGAHPLRRREPVVRRLAHGLARAGFVVAVPDVPGLGDGAIGERSARATEAVALAMCERPDVRGGRVALIGASAGAGLALVAAARPELRGRISVVAAVAPFADLRKLVRLTTTGAYADERGPVAHAVTDLHRLVVARSLAAALSGEARDRLLAELVQIETEGLDPLEELPRRCADLGGDAEPLLALLATRDPEQFDARYEALPATVLAFAEELSPLRVCGAIRASVELVVPPNDAYFPLGEAVALARAIPHSRLTVTGTLDHTRPAASLRRLGDLAAFGRFVVRGLAASG